jgi:ubiquitin thioesterase protein OTUB1
MYENNVNAQSFNQGLKSLERTYSDIRVIRGDGNCFYRAFLYSLAEQLLPVDETRNQRRLAFLKDPLERNWSNIIAMDGYDELTLEIFYETTRDFVQTLTTAEILHDDLSQENAVSDYTTWFLRLVTAAHLKQNAERFLPFIITMNSNGPDSLGAIASNDSDTTSLSYANQVMTQFCATQVEPMNRECEDVHIMALAEAMQCQVSVEYLDGHSAVGQVTRHVFGPSDDNDNSLPPLYKIHLLYRPGHYDVLYLRE